MGPVGNSSSSSRFNETDQEKKKSVGFSKSVTLRRFNTTLSDNESLVIIRLHSTQSSETSTQVDEPEIELSSEIESSPKKRKLASEEHQDTVKSVKVSLIPANEKKSYPRPVPLIKDKITQWLDPLEKEKKALSKIFKEIFIEQGAVSSTIEKRIPTQLKSLNESHINQVIGWIIETLIDHFKNLVVKSRFCHFDHLETTHFLEAFIERFTIESNLDLETYFQACQRRLPKAKTICLKTEETDNLYTFRTVSDGERERLIKSVPVFLSNSSVRDYLKWLLSQIKENV